MDGSLSAIKTSPRAQRRRSRDQRRHRDRAVDVRIPMMLVAGLSLTVVALLATIDRAPTRSQVLASDRQGASAVSPMAFPNPARR